MNVQSLVAALVLCGPLLQPLAHAVPANDPRTPINAVETPGDADSVFRITQPGSYYLEANLDGVAGKSGIKVEVPNVQIDLMGFRLKGVEGSASAIRLIATTSDISIVNGTITSWDAFAVEGSLTVQDTRVRDLEVFHCASGGITLGPRSVVERCNFRLTSGIAIDLGMSSTVSRCRITGGERGITVGEAALVDDCAVEFVADRGIQVGLQSTVRVCIARSCGGAAMILGSGSSVLACTASNSVAGIFGSGALRVIDSTIEDNSSDGVRLATGLVRGCSIARNGHRGVDVEQSAEVVGNSLLANGLDGIRAHGASRIEENDVRGHLNGAGIRVHGTGSFIVKNTLASNVSTILAPNAGNFVGTLVFVNGLNGRNDPWANLYTN